MTFKGFVKQHLVSNGMFDNQADVVIEMAINNEANKAMLDRWDDNISDYPEIMQSVILIGVNRCAAEYIKENCPKAWFRPLFDKEYAKQIGLDL